MGASQESVRLTDSETMPSPRRSGRNHQSQSSQNQVQEDADVVVMITVEYDDQRKTFALNRNDKIQTLQKYIERDLGIPIRKQFIFGWPDLEPDNPNVQFKTLNLPMDVNLNVAVMEQEEGMPSSEVAHSSRSVPANQERLEGQTFQLNVTDVEHNESYELPFNGLETVADVKFKLGQLSSIDMTLQEWSGWPENATNDMLLKDCDLDTPFHSLILMKIPQSSPLDFETPPVQRQQEQPSTSPKADVGQHKPEVATPKSQRPTARKRVSEGARLQVKELITKLKEPEIETSSSSKRFKPSDQDQADSSEIHSRSCGPSTSKAGKSIEVKQNQVTIISHSSTFEVANSDEERIDATSHSGSSAAVSPKKKQIASAFINLPEKVVTRLLHYLDPLTQLSLRRVCKATNKWTERKTINLHEEESWKNFQLVVTGEGLRTFETACRLSLPITSYGFEVNSTEFYEKNGFDHFRETICFRIKNLSLSKFFMFQNQHESMLFLSLHNLEKLTLNNLVMVNNSQPADDAPPFPCPPTLTNLQVLKLNYEVDIPQDNVLLRPKSWDLTWSMLHDCQSLLYFRFPRINEQRCNNIGTKSKAGLFTPLLEYIETRQRLGGVAIEYLDMKHFNNPDSYCLNRFVDLLRKCYTREIKLTNINALVVQQVFDEDDDISDDKLKFCENVISLINYRPFVENAPLQNLEKITVDVIPSATDFVTLGKGYKNVFWPKLRVIKIKDSVQVKPKPEIVKCWQSLQEDLYGLRGVFERSSVKYIKIDCPSTPYFLSEGRLAAKFSKLNRLEIVSWFRDDSESVLNKRLLPLWKLRLEELRIENCPALNDGSFIGDDEDAPKFLNLTPTLKKITLGLNGSKSVTDRSMIVVFSRMKLRTFILLSSTPLKISEKALLKMRKREFGKHIEHFPFDCWSSTLLDPDRFARLGNSFRSMR